MNKQQIISQLRLERHIEGGYFSRTYQSTLKVSNDTAVDLVSGSRSDNSRHLLSSIYYMLTDDSPIGYLHKNLSDIIHYYHAGSPLKYILLFPNGRLEEKYLGHDLAMGQQLQLVVTGGCWKATELIEGEFALISEAVSPGFVYSDMKLANQELIKKISKDKYSKLKKYIKE